MPYTKQTWSDEVPNTSPVRYKITQTTDGDIASNAKIELVTPVTAGSPVNATRLNYMETGIETAQATAEAAVPKSLFTAIGQLLYSTAAGVVAALAKPSVDAILKMTAAGVPSWKALTEIPQVVGRQGGSATAWNTQGTTNYTPTNQKIQCGAGRITFSAQVQSSMLVTYPVAFTYPPVILLTPMSSSVGGQKVDRPMTAANQIATRFYAFADVAASTTGTLDFFWMAIGE